MLLKNHILPYTMQFLGYSFNVNILCSLDTFWAGLPTIESENHVYFFASLLASSIQST